MRTHKIKWFLHPIGILLLTAWVVMGQMFRVVNRGSSSAEGGAETDWRTVGFDHAETRYSPLNQINAATVSRLGLDWSVEIGAGGGAQSATPLVADGVLYGITNWSITFAIDLRTQRELWRYDPQVDRRIDAPGSDRICCGVVNRGVALHEGKVLVPVIDGRLVALDAGTGSVLWSVLTVPEDSVSYSITIAPRVVNGKVIVGNGGSEFPPYRGYFTAYDAGTGAQIWRFYTVPGDPSQPFESPALEKAAQTWSGEWWKYGGGGPVWDGMAYDPEENLLYVGVGNATPWPNDIRSGKDAPRQDNLFVSSIVAVDADTGELKWHYQCTPGDDWDYDAVQHLILANLVIGGNQRKAIMQANKNGSSTCSTGSRESSYPVNPSPWSIGPGESTLSRDGL
jgi:quinohemoprotein ethanol dehydrogenase